ncbi:MAG: tetratricopeptide repeat protein [Pyrinomonadaceae bacterium]
MDELGRVIQRGVSDGSGRYMFRGLSSGRFAVKVLPFGTNFAPQTRDVEIYGIGVTGRSLADNVQLDFYLQIEKRGGDSNAVNEVIFAQDVPNEALSAYRKAVSDIENDQLNAGIEGLKESIRLFPTYFLALEKLGLLYNKDQKFEDAVEIFSRAVEVNDKSFTCWYGLGFANYALKRWKDAVTSVQKAIVINPISPEAQLLLGISQRQNKEYVNAEVSLVKAKELSSGNAADIHWNLALLYYYNLQKQDKAADELDAYLLSLSEAERKTNPDKVKAVKALIKKIRKES